MHQGSRSSSAHWFRLRIPRVGWCFSHLSLDDLEGPLPSPTTWLLPGGFSSSPCEPLSSGWPQSQEHQRENDTGSTRSHNLLCKATYHYFCHFLLARVRSQSLSTINKEDCALHGVTWDHLRTWLPPHPSLKWYFTNSAANTISLYSQR